MADISKVQLPSGNVYNIKDEVARQAIAGGISKIIAWDGRSEPVIGNIPAGVSVTYDSTTYTGTLTADDADITGIYFVYSTAQSDVDDTFDEYTVVGPANARTWERFGNTRIDLSGFGTLAFKSTVTLNKGTGDSVLGEATTFTNGSSSVSFAAHTKGSCLGSNATFQTVVLPTTTNVKATASGTAVSSDGTDTFVKSYPGTTSKLATTTVPNVTNNTDVSIPNVTSAGSASTWAFALGTGENAETLIISGANSVPPTLGTALSASKITLGTAKTVATGSLAANGGGDSVMTGLGTPTTNSALTGVKVTSQPTISLATDAAAGTGVIALATGIASSSTTANNKDEVSAITALGAATAAAQTITVGTNDKVTVAKHGDLSVTVS